MLGVKASNPKIAALPGHSMQPRLALTAQTERFPIAGTFRIARGAKTEAVVVTVTAAWIENGTVRARGRGEGVPYARYGETVESVLAQIEGAASALEATSDPRAALQALLPAGAARNAIDCALWDLEAKSLGRPAWRLAHLDEPQPLTTAFTLSVDTPEAMEAAAAKAAHLPHLKIKLAGAGDEARLRAVRRGAPEARLIVDANEGWTPALLPNLTALCAEAGVAWIEQPLPAAADEALRGFASPVPLVADESVHDRASLGGLVGKYRAVNLKLDKTGGLTEALAARAEAERLGFAIMVGCMVSTSLAMAPAFLLAQAAAVVDLDGPLLLAADREAAIVYDGGRMQGPTAALWG
jgi:L-alanine-DL-glutamate epimerase-like enolase superfamily enzyme